MTATTVAPAPAVPAFPKARPGSRAARLALPRAVEALRNLAAEHGVCVRPVTLRRTDLATGETQLIDLPCGATLEAKCPPCAKRAHATSERDREIAAGMDRRIADQTGKKQGKRKRRRRKGDDGDDGTAGVLARTS